VRGRKSERGSLVRHPGRTGHAGTRWVTERIPSPDGEGRHPNQNRNDRHERHHGRRPTRKQTKTAFRKTRSWLPEIFLPLDRSR